MPPAAPAAPSFDRHRRQSATFWGVMLIVLGAALLAAQFVPSACRGGCSGRCVDHRRRHRPGGHARGRRHVDGHRGSSRASAPSLIGVVLLGNTTGLRRVDGLADVPVAVAGAAHRAGHQHHRPGRRLPVAARRLSAAGVGDARARGVPVADRRGASAPIGRDGAGAQDPRRRSERRRPSTSRSSRTAASRSIRTW